MRERWLSPCVGILLLAASNLAAAAAQRTFVASSGVDNPGCSLAAPCRSFAAAIAATNAGGEVIVLDSAGYGSVTITKAVSIIAPAGVYGGISVFSGDGVTINAPGATVVLRGLSINGQGGTNGILSQAAARVRIEDCVVSNMGGIGVYDQAASGEMMVLDTIVRDNGGTGIALVATNASIALDHVRSEHNQYDGLYVAPAPGSSNAWATVTDSVFVHNGHNGMWADSVSGAATSVIVERTDLSRNAQHGYYATAGASGAFVYSTLTRNSFSTNGYTIGIHSLGASPGQSFVWAHENAFNGNEIRSDGQFSLVYASANSGANLVCQNTGAIWSLGNNYGGVVFSSGCTVSVVGGI